MKKTLLILFLYSLSGLQAQVCQALFSSEIQKDKVSFYNLSTVANAHYYWNFGDGYSSNYKNPIHTFPGNGTFLTTLYVYDSINQCSSYFEKWLTIFKYDPSVCYPLVNDSIFVDPFHADQYLITINDLSHANCAPRVQQFHFNAGAGNGQANTFVHMNYPSTQLAFVKYSTPYVDEYSAFKTSLFKFNPSKNYTGCSANFEIRNSGTTFEFVAMNKQASSYTWYLMGFGAPIVYHTASCKQAYPMFLGTYPVFQEHGPVILVVTDANGCKDSVLQTFAARNPTIPETTEGTYSINEDMVISSYPNPVADFFHLEFAHGNADEKTIRIFNAIGQQVYSLNTINHAIDLDFSGMAQGIYLLSAESSGKNKTFKLLKD
ncbi:MAG: T9SS type A sorting domain-containing protein [Mucilaginibacter sp.]